jgi:hypothetical protein
MDNVGATSVLTARSWGNGRRPTSEMRDKENIDGVQVILRGRPTRRAALQQQAFLQKEPPALKRKQQ